MPLINFGSILAFAEEIENQNLDFIAGAAKSPSCSEGKPLFDTLSQTGKKRVRELQRIRRENVTEMILENIEAFFRKSYLVEIPDTADLEPPEAVETSRALLERTVRYYGDAALKLKGQSEVSRSLKTLGKKCRRDLDKLK